MLPGRHPHLVIDKHPSCKEASDAPPPPPPLPLPPLPVAHGTDLTPCFQVIEALQRCHAENPVSKFWGVCNDQKLALDRCFAQEKVTNR